MGVSGGAFEGVEDQVSPFGYGRGEGVDAGHGDPEWICSKEKPRYDEIFRQLSPIDGKVTGAGTLIHQQLRTLVNFLHTHPHLRSHLVVDRGMEAFLVSSRNCSLLTELLVSMNDRQPQLRNDESFIKLVDILSTATYNCRMVTQCLSESRDADAASSSGMSSAISIHSLHESSFNDDPTDGFVSSIPRRRFGGAANRFFDENTRRESNTDGSVQSEDSPVNRNVRQNQSDSPIIGVFHFIETCINDVSETIKIMVLFLVTVLAWLLMAQFIFMAVVYSETGNFYIEFELEKLPQSWLDWTKKVAFGPQFQTVRIHNVFGLLNPENTIKILKYLLNYLQAR